MKVSGFFVILLTQDGFKSDCPERKSSNHFPKSVQEQGYVDVLQNRCY